MAQHLAESLVRFAHVAAAIVWLALIYFTASILPKIMKGLPETARGAAVPVVAKTLVPLVPPAAGTTLLFGFILLAMRGARNLELTIHIGMGLGIVMFAIGIAVSMIMKRNLKRLEAGQSWDMQAHAKALKLGRINAVLGVITLFLMVFGAHGVGYFPLPDVVVGM